MTVVLSLLSLNAFGFGSSGSDGRDGSSGHDGSSGESVTIFADGQAQDFILNGLNGSACGNGTSGSSASGCYYPERHSNEFGADGGIGGSVTVFYTDIILLKNIYLESNGGYGAPGG